SGHDRLGIAGTSADIGSGRWNGGAVSVGRGGKELASGACKRGCSIGAELAGCNADVSTGAVGRAKAEVGVPTGRAGGLEIAERTAERDGRACAVVIGFGMG